MNSKLFLAIPLFFLLLSCENDTEKKTATYLGGEIVNSNDNYITLFKDNILIDSILLNKDKKFSYSFEEKNFSAGLYTFRHTPESQVFYIEEGDSLLLRVNMDEFDESLMYTKDKSQENNFLMEMYLLNEKDNDLILSYYKMSPKDFAQKTDSIKDFKLERLTSLKNKYEFSENFTEVAQKTIDYEYYDLRERYAYLINRYFSDFRNRIPKDFFDYRKKVNFNDQSIQSYYTYQRFLDNYLKNKAIEDCIKSTPKDSLNYCFRVNTVGNLRQRLQIADSLFEIKGLRNRFLSNLAKKQVNFSVSDNQIDSTIQLVNKFDLPQEQVTELEALGSLQKQYFVGKNVSNAKLLSANGEKIKIEDISRKPMITYTWSLYQESHKIHHHLINELRNKYPEITFIAVNIDEEDTKLWLKSIENFGYDKNFEYQIRDRKNKRYLYKSLLDKVLILDKKGTIVQNKLNLDSPNFENKILQFLNQ
ncbi:TlpA family protein disulfide reductase [Mesonia ostreae]|uniref:Thioredoxin domain-containing protein n=1 Tax=Mesonia ostreae TaxID=861110 RepID=A0ABU2KKM9_9FLAO|nr:hypothetical protein [Mesonia ostreae]MDT0295209.1 hypothetical protein [Mesonia ostreae]